MKNIAKYTVIIAMSLLVAVACRDEDAVRFPDLLSAVNARLVLDPDKSYINFADLSNASVGFDVYSVNTDIEELIYTAKYVDASNPTQDFPAVEAIVIPGSAFVNGKVMGAGITATELATKLGLPGGTAYFEGGDQVTFTASAKLTDGRVIDGADAGPSISGGSNASFTTKFTVFVGCPSPVADITGKTYTATIVTLDSDGNAPFGLPNTSTKEGVTIKFTGPEPFRYTVSSHDAGWWARPEVTETEGGGADFFDICGTVIMQPKASFGFGGANDEGGGSYDPSTGVIEMNWFNSFNDIHGRVVYTPED